MTDLHAPARPEPLPPPEAARRPLRAYEAILLALAALLPWFLAGSVPLLPPDEGRYASVSATMVDTGRWLVPEFEGRAHLTKPPLAYWLQAMAISVGGREEWAVRFPSVLATSLTILATFAFGRRMFGTRPALVAALTLPVMPLVGVVGRLATTDAPLLLCWTLALGFGWRAIGEGKTRHAAAFWVATGVGLLVKSVAAFGPLLILLAWVALARRPMAALRLRPALAFLAILPVGAWLFLVSRSQPEILAVGWHETFGRAIGSKGIRAEPWWFFVPVGLVGFFPATAMMTLPIVNQPIGASLRTFLAGDARALCLVATVLPFVGFSLSTGKLATYLLPLAPAAALLASLTLERWMSGAFDRPPAWFRPPDVRYTLAAITAIVGLGSIALAFAVRAWAPTLWAEAIPGLILPTVAIAVAIAWRSLATRERGLLAVWIGFSISAMLLSAIAVRHVRPMGADGMLAELRDRFGDPTPDIVAVRFEDPTIAFYNDGQPTLETPSLELLARADPPPGAIVLVHEGRNDEESWAEMARGNPEVASRLVPVGRWYRWFAKPTRIFVWNPAP